ncbi:hypothetical protein F2P79_005846 [Pimephales promelas]|nr:hypothetical protein F2P79_005846 [Pimephales promelas]
MSASSGEQESTQLVTYTTPSACQSSQGLISSSLTASCPDDVDAETKADCCILLNLGFNTCSDNRKESKSY